MHQEKCPRSDLLRTRWSVRRKRRRAGLTTPFAPLSVGFANIIINAAAPTPILASAGRLSSIFAGCKPWMPVVDERDGRGCAFVCGDIDAR